MKTKFDWHQDAQDAQDAQKRESFLLSILIFHGGLHGEFGQDWGGDWRKEPGGYDIYHLMIKDMSGE
jgi:hypothetical protein